MFQMNLERRTHRANNSLDMGRGWGGGGRTKDDGQIIRKTVGPPIGWEERGMMGTRGKSSRDG